MQKVNITSASKEKEEQTTALAALTDARKALEEQHRCEGAAALALEKEKEVARNLERQLLAAQKVAEPEADDAISSHDDDTSSRDATVVVHMFSSTCLAAHSLFKGRAVSICLCFLLPKNNCYNTYSIFFYRTYDNALQ
jgi:hypothetical protein